MRITCVGGGPAGLLFSILTSSAGHDVTVLERQPPAESFGWGVVFWDNLLRQLDQHEPATGAAIREHAYTWHDQVVTVNREEPVRIPGYGYSMRRRLLLELLRARAAEAGVRIEEQRFVGAADDLPQTDLVIASDGVNSRLRSQEPAFGTSLDRRRNFYLWLGTEAEFDSFTFPFVQTPSGWLWAHAYGFDRDASTFVVETNPETWTALGFDRMAPEPALRRLEEIFADSLNGHRLYPQAGTRERLPWTNFTVVRNRRWHVDRVALMGDAAHTTHFTIGSGTRLAMEDAMCLAAALAAETSIEAALDVYESTRQRELADVQRTATRSARWYEQVPRYITQPTADFARMMDDRRSPVMPRLPVGVYLGLRGTLDRMPGLAAPIRRLVSRF